MDDAWKNCNAVMKEVIMDNIHKYKVINKRRPLLTRVSDVDQSGNEC